MNSKIASNKVSIILSSDVNYENKMVIMRFEIEHARILLTITFRTQPVNFLRVTIISLYPRNLIEIPWLTHVITYTLHTIFTVYANSRFLFRKK